VCICVRVSVCVFWEERTGCSKLTMSGELRDRLFEEKTIEVVLAVLNGRMLLHARRVKLVTNAVEGDPECEWDADGVDEDHAHRVREH